MTCSPGDGWWRKEMKLPPPQESYHNPDGGGWRKETKLPPPQESYPSPAVALVVEGGGKRWRFLLLKSHTTALPWPYGHTTALVVERWRKMTTTTTLPPAPQGGSDRRGESE